MKNIKPFAPPTLPIGYSAGRTSLCGSGHLFCMKKPKVFLPVEDLPGEIWKPIPGFSRYMASNKGRIKRLQKQIKDSVGHEYIVPERICPEHNRNGYRVVNTIGDDGKKRTVLVHRLIAFAFLPNPKKLSEINHIDWDKANNRIENLEWVTPRENSVHGKSKKPKTSKYPGVIRIQKRPGKKWTFSIMIEQKIRYGKYYHTEEEAYMAYKQFCKEHNIQNKYA